MKNYLFSILTFFLALGILISEKLNTGTNLRIYLLAVFFALFISYLMPYHKLKLFAKCSQIIIIGILIHQVNNDKLLTENNAFGELKIHHLHVKEIYKPSVKYQKYKVKNNVDGTIGLLHIPIKDSVNFYPNDTLIISGKKYELQSTKNPYQFDYSLWLKRKNIDYTIYSDQILSHQSAPFTWKRWSVESKEILREKLKKLGYTTEARSIISSMLLGDRSEISQELNESYILTGVVHILSISGLHVVMIYIIIQFILKPTRRIKNGKNFSIILSLLIIWLFAFYVDMQPPVFRSALMISIYYISELLKRTKNIYHTISLSAFVILLFQPNSLFDVGFQLSFAAVFFIVWLNPIYRIIYSPKQKLVQYFYDLSGTSVSAQLGTIPFATYYFNQFSGLFLFGNLFLVPASFLMIIGAIIAILLSILNLEFPLYTNLFNWFINLCNTYIKWLSNFDGLVLKQVYISTLSALLIFIILICLRPLILKHSKIALLIILGCFLGLTISRFIDLSTIRKSNEIIVFNQFKSSLIGIRNGQKLTIIHSENLDSTQTKNYSIRPFEIHNRIKNTTYISIDSTYYSDDIYKTKNILIVGNHRLFIGENLTYIPNNIDYILIRNSSFNPNDINNLSQIKRVIADASNYPHYISELEKLLKNHSDSILWITSKQGYYPIRF